MLFRGTVEKMEFSLISNGAVLLRTIREQRGRAQKGPSSPEPVEGKATAPLARGAYRVVPERERREERQGYEPEGAKGPRTPLTPFFNTLFFQTLAVTVCTAIHQIL